MDAQVTIPMPSGVDSFSVNAAAAVLLYEAGRRPHTSAPPSQP
jgi:tRNA G18 (ribose-2'-O)-methylase SpoU